MKDPDNFQYNLAKKREKYTYYICQKLRENGCKVTATVSHGENGDVIVDRSGQHSHDSDLLKTVAKRVLQEIVGKYGKMELKMWMETVAGYYNDVK